MRQATGEPFKVSSSKAIRAAIDRYLKQAPINKSWSIFGDYEFKKANDRLNAVCKNLQKEGKVGVVVQKTPITNEQLQKLFERSQKGRRRHERSYSYQRGVTHTCISGGKEEKNFIFPQTPRVDDILTCEPKRLSGDGCVNKKP